MKMEEPHKRYLLFVIESYYPTGGLGDIEGSFSTIEEVRAYMKVNKIDAGWEVYDRAEGVEVDPKIIVVENA